MRITGGLARGINLSTGGREDMRPATDMLRQAVFSSLGADVCDVDCLDLFAGTGAYGLESLSRGAKSVRFVEMSRDGVKAIGVNVQAVCKSMKATPEVCEVESGDVFRWSAGGRKYGLIFADPPYAMLPGKASAIFELAAGCISEGGLFVFEMPGGLELSHPRMTLVKRLGKGRNDPSACVYCVTVKTGVVPTDS